MTHNDILKKFLIEYDKANITSSYPSLTKVEIATILDKAYLALIAQKVTGNNQRKVPFEADIKSVEDLRPLVKQVENMKDTDAMFLANNEVAFIIPSDLLYTIGIRVQTNNNSTYNVDPVTHDLASKYKVTANNMPWLQQPVAYFENNQVRVLYDSYEYDKYNTKKPIKCWTTYIKYPTKFTTFEDEEFELNDSMANELVNLAIVFATEVTESPRLQTKSSLLTLES